MKSRPSALRDFTVDRRVWLLTAVAPVIGAGGAALAVFLLRAIAFCTNIFYYHRFSLAMVGPAGSPEPPWIMPLVPVVGGIIVGLMAHYGSDKIRGHGIPEAIEAILLRGARVDPKVADPQAALRGHRHRFRRTVRRGRPDHHDRRRLRLVDRAMAASFATPNAPRCWWPAPRRACRPPSPPPSRRSCWPSSCSSSSGGRVRSFPWPWPASWPTLLRICWLGPGPLFPVVLHHGMRLEPSLLVAAPLGIVVGLASAGSQPPDVRP